MEKTHNRESNGYTGENHQKLSSDKVYVVSLRAYVYKIVLIIGKKINCSEDQSSIPQDLKPSKLRPQITDNGKSIYHCSFTAARIPADQPGQINNGQYLKLTVISKETSEMCNKCPVSSQCNNSDQRSSVKMASSNLPVRIQLSPNCRLKTDSKTGTSLMFYSDKQSWIEALNYCLSLNSSLVQISNQTVQDAVINLLKNETGLEEGIWVGLERSIFGTTNIEWMWTSRNRTIHPEWNSRVDPLNNHCGKIVLAEDPHRVKLADANCHHSLPFICQDPV
ncbi:hypothetical protein CHARACLAT_016161 [Characodon lateralis]|uniref:C-type lectin domain-containing protein n=1 Tax=Characodon lateralis TaxID=208331 RepID=A0ABU7DRS1_9TELE|nr:hypothetical protein [Characodon lateralis]